RCPHVYERHRTLKGCPAEPRHHLAIALEPGKRRQIGDRRRTPDQRRRNSRRVAGAKPIKKQGSKPKKNKAASARKTIRGSSSNRLRCFLPEPSLDAVLIV